MTIKLPKPSDQAIAQSHELTALIKTHIDHNGPLSFTDYMNLVLYTPGLGYYSSDLQKFGSAGDFITAPEISPLFGQCLATAFDTVLANLKNPVIVEIGAGTGKLAADMLKNLRQPIERYYIVEISAELREKQQAYLQEHCPQQFHLIQWLDTLPTQSINGVIFGNEIIDALPVTCFEKQGAQIFERKVSYKNQQFTWENHPAKTELTHEVHALNLAATFYQSEINLDLKTWLRSLNNCLNQGVMLFIDYGFPEREYYHPQRCTGTLMCHYQHHAHPDPFYYPGLQDITAHVDFTRIALAADELGLSVDGYCNQASFLIDQGIEKLAVNLDLATSQAIQTLLFPHEMGELFKVIVLSKNCAEPQQIIKNDCQYKL